jgi:hypothetical protein
VGAEYGTDREINFADPDFIRDPNRPSAGCDHTLR